MRQKTTHSIDFIFPVILFSFFTLCAAALIILAADVYSETVKQSGYNTDSAVALSYVTEKIHHSDEQGAIEAGTFAGSDALVIHQGEYITYIYAYDGALYELYQKADAQIPPEAGTQILNISSFSIEDKGSLLHISCEGADGSISETQVAVRSGKGVS